MFIGASKDLEGRPSINGNGWDSTASVSSSSSSSTSSPSSSSLPTSDLDGALGLAVDCCVLVSLAGKARSMMECNVSAAMPRC